MCVVSEYGYSVAAGVATLSLKTPVVAGYPVPPGAFTLARRSNPITRPDPTTGTRQVRAERSREEFTSTSVFEIQISKFKFKLFGDR